MSPEPRAVAFGMQSIYKSAFETPFWVTNAVSLNAAAPEIVAGFTKIGIPKVYAAFKSVVATAMTQMINNGIAAKESGEKTEKT